MTLFVRSNTNNYSSPFITETRKVLVLHLESKRRKGGLRHSDKPRSELFVKEAQAVVLVQLVISFGKRFVQ